MSSLSLEDAYKILDISNTASDEEVRAAYKKLALKTHPDKNPNDPAAHHKFLRISEAFKRISDPYPSGDEYDSDYDDEYYDSDEEEFAFRMFERMFFGSSGVRFGFKSGGFTFAPGGRGRCGCPECQGCRRPRAPYVPKSQRPKDPNEPEPTVNPNAHDNWLSDEESGSKSKKSSKAKNNKKKQPKKKTQKQDGGSHKDVDSSAASKKRPKPTSTDHPVTSSSPSKPTTSSSSITSSQSKKASASSDDEDDDISAEEMARRLVGADIPETPTSKQPSTKAKDNSSKSSKKSSQSEKDSLYQTFTKPKSRTSNSAHSSKPTDKYKSQVSALMEMGFDRESSLKALEVSLGSVELATMMLLSESTDPGASNTAVNKQKTDSKIKSANEDKQSKTPSTTSLNGHHSKEPPFQSAHKKPPPLPTKQNRPNAPPTSNKQSHMHSSTKHGPAHNGPTHHHKPPMAPASKQPVTQPTNPWNAKEHFKGTTHSHSSKTPTVQLGQHKALPDRHTSHNTTTINGSKSNDIKAVPRPPGLDFSPTTSGIKSNSLSNKQHSSGNRSTPWTASSEVRCDGKLEIVESQPAPTKSDTLHQSQPSNAVHTSADPILATSPSLNPATSPVIERPSPRSQPVDSPPGFFDASSAWGLPPPIEPLTSLDVGGDNLTSNHFQENLVSSSSPFDSTPVFPALDISDGLHNIDGLGLSLPSSLQQLSSTENDGSSTYHHFQGPHGGHYRPFSMSEQGESKSLYDDDAPSSGIPQQPNTSSLFSSTPASSMAPIGTIRASSQVPVSNSSETSFFSSGNSLGGDGPDLAFGLGWGPSSNSNLSLGLNSSPVDSSLSPALNSTSSGNSSLPPGLGSSSSLNSSFSSGLSATTTNLPPGLSSTLSIESSLPPGLSSTSSVSSGLPPGLTTSSAVSSSISSVLNSASEAIDIPNSRENMPNHGHSHDNAKPPSSPIGPKTKACSFFSSPKGCRLGQSCRFSHHESSSTRGHSPSKHHSSTNQKPCAYHNLPGGCRHGSNCKFSHI